MALDAGDALDTVRGDFERIRRSGFDGVTLWYAEDGARAELLDLARSAGLTAAVPDRAVHFYVLTGSFRPGVTQVGDLLKSIPAGVAEHPAFVVVVVDPGGTMSSINRAAEVSTALRRRGVECLLAGTAPIADPIRTWAQVVTSEPPRDGGASPTGALLAQFVKELSLGRTKGLLVDRYYRVSGEPAGFDLATGLETPAAAAAVAALLARARQWGPRVAGLSAEPMPAAAGDAPGTRLTLLADDERRYLLVSNPPGGAACRGFVTVPQQVRGKAVTRAVEVASASDRLPTAAVTPRQGVIKLNVDLRPGDAALFEIF